MRTRTRFLLSAGIGLPVVLVGGAALTPPCDGYGCYSVRVTWDQTKNNFVLEGKPDPVPYELDFTGHIDWRFTNGTDDGALKVSVENFECNNVPTKDCPLHFEKNSPGTCDSMALPLGKTGTLTIQASDDVGYPPTPKKTCPQGGGGSPWYWSHYIVVTKADGTRFITDPELEIDRGGGLVKIRRFVKLVLRRIKGFLHL